MSKELEALKQVNELIKSVEEYKNKTGKDNPTICMSEKLLISIQNALQPALQRLEEIDNAEINEAFECVDYIEKKLAGLRYECKRTKNHRCDDLFIQEHIFDAIKQALIKAQEQEKVLSIIKGKCLHTDNLNYVAVCINYDMYKEKMSEKHDTVVIKIDWNDRELLDCLKLLTQEEFELLKRYCN